jgi:hypothetical protein
MLNARQLEEWANAWTTMSQEDWSKRLNEEAATTSNNSQSPHPAAPSSSSRIPMDKETVHLKNLENCKVNNRQTILLDIGAVHNVAGINTIKDMERVARAAGKQARYTKRTKILAVNGVGEGSAPCYEQVDMPIAVGYENRPAELSTYRTNVATEIGADLPAILGNLSMEERDAVLLLRPGHQQIVFPGPEGYKIEWSAGTKICPISKSDSRHYHIECDHWEHTQQTQPSQSVLFTNHWISRE